MSRTFAYARVSTVGQTTENQLREIAAAGFGVLCYIPLVWITWRLHAVLDSAHPSPYFGSGGGVVSIVRDGAPKVIATCSTGYESTDEQCPDPDDDAETRAIAHWNTSPTDSSFWTDGVHHKAVKYDADLDPTDIDQPWFNECLTSSVYPPPPAISPNLAPKK